MVMRTMTAGTTHRTPPELQLEFLAAGATVEASAGPDLGQISIKTTRERASKAAELLADITLNPSFPDTAFQSARSFYLGKASDELESPLSGTYAIFLRTMYRVSPFERPAFGNVRAIAECRKGDMLALYRKLF